MQKESSALEGEEDVKFGTPEYPLSGIPFQELVNHAESGRYQAKPAKIFRLEEMQDAHRLETGQANGKIVITLQ